MRFLEIVIIILIFPLFIVLGLTIGTVNAIITFNESWEEQFIAIVEEKTK